MPSASPTAPTDYVDGVRSQWNRLFPGLDTGAVDIVGRINRISQIIQLRSDAVLAANRITRAEFDMLSLLARAARPMAPTELAAELLISGPGTTKRIKKLVDAGLAEREANPLDGRGTLIRLTPHAASVLRPILEDVLRLEESLISALDPAAASALAGHLRALLSSLEPQSGGS
ncbi:MarR family winged helix-turn-helix transcriptional regulator [Sinomonas sp. P10A9]|uniref:MarR family winged helix-turn-helix transcriptional regulator n=1 Tax=Sinomonas puerhi TaxID=3238584 RepID=A0AB39L5L9_9MICC